MLAPTPENFRAEISRHRLARKPICRHIGMHPNQFSQFVTALRPLTGWAAHNIGWAINVEVGFKVFDVDMDKGPVESPRGRPPQSGLNGVRLDPGRKPWPKAKRRTWARKRVSS